MTKASIEIGGINMGTSIQGTQKNKAQTKDPFHALVMANFSGDKEFSNNLKPIQIDRDNFDEILTKIQPCLNLEIENKHAIELQFKELENFEPDALYEGLDIFAQLRSLRRRLSNQATFSEAAQEMRDWGNINPSTPEASNTETTVETGNLLDAMLAETVSREEINPSTSGSELAKNLIRDIVAPHILPSADPKQTEYIESVDNSISELMNTILHHPKFQALESAWRGLYFTIKRTKTDTDLKLFLLDISKVEIKKAVDADDEKNTIFYKNIVEPYTGIAGAKSWSVWMGDYEIKDQADDIFFLERMGKLAQHTNATFISGASPQLVSCQNIANTPDADDWQLNRNNNLLKAWQYLRDSSQAKHLALLFPKFLARLPYGLKTKAVECFEYEEMPESIHENYLWANAGYALLYLLAESYSLDKWQFKPGQLNEISGLPVHIYEDEGEQHNKPCAEILLTENGGEKALQHGIIPVWSVKHEDKIRIGPMVSLHSEAQLITGQWVC